MGNFFHEFKQFIARGNVLDLAVGLAIGTAFQKIVSSLVSDIIMPAISPLMNNMNFADWHIGKVMIGNFITNCVDFIIVAFFIFLVVRFANRFKRKDEEKKEVEISHDQKIEALLAEIRDLLKSHNPVNSNK